MINSAYNSLNAIEREAVDQYIQAVVIYAERQNEHIIHALNRPIPPDVIARSRGQLDKPLVKAAIYDKIVEISNEKDLSAQRLLREHMNLAMSNMGDYLKFEQVFDKQNNRFVDLPPSIELKNCTREQLAAVKSVKVKSGMFGTSVTIELHNKQTSLDTLSKMMGLDQPDNAIYQRHIAPPKDIKPLPATATQEEAEKAYSELLESMK